ncbi:MAG TPA: ABC transporter permease [Candidatus Eisenbacteria bacterium]
MIGHIVRMVWNRKRTTGLLLVELLVSYLVLCVVFSAAASYYINWKKPLGYDYHDVLTLTASAPPTDDFDREARGHRLEEAARLEQAIRTLPNVVAVSPLVNVPYSGSGSRRGLNMKDGSLIQFFISQASIDMKEVFKFSVVQGRWLEPADFQTAWTPIVVNRALARRLFGNEDPIGRTIESYDENGTLRVAEDESDNMKVVGVIDDFRKGGEFSDSPYAGFVPQYTDPGRAWPSDEYMVRVNPGTPAAFEEQLITFVRSVLPDYSVRVESLEASRATYFKTTLLPLIVGGIVAWFLILMVGMGLVGVLWQNVAQRSREFGLRRALGANGGDVVRQVVGEMLALTTLAVLAGAVLFLQVPMLKLPGFINLRTALTAILAAVVVLYPFVALCSLYPSWLAARVQPVEALHAD